MRCALCFACRHLNWCRPSHTGIWEKHIYTYVDLIFMDVILPHRLNKEKNNATLMQHLMRFEPDFNRLPCYYWTWIVIHSQVYFHFQNEMSVTHPKVEQIQQTSKRRTRSALCLSGHREHLVWRLLFLVNKVIHWWHKVF